MGKQGDSLSGQLALVTGAGRRIGRAIAEELSRAGARVAVHYHTSASEAEEVAAGLRDGFAVQADLRDPAAAQRLIDEVTRREGDLHILVNSAASFAATPFGQMTDADWQAQLDLNLTAPQRMIRLALPRGLHVAVNLLDIAAWQPWKGYAAYGVAKAGLLYLTRQLARELAPVRINAVAPGVVDLEDGPLLSRLLSRTPLARPGEASEVARAVRFLIEEPYLTGVCLPVDGGQGLR